MVNYPPGDADGYNGRMAMALSDFKRTIWRHYRAHGRHALAWRKTKDPYAILVSEIMLQQTQVPRVEGFYEAWLARFPDFAALAAARTADVLAAWQGLGYNRRALALKRLAETVVREYGGRLPEDRAALEKLPGIGKGTSGSLMAFVFDRPEPFIETNVRRVFIHCFFPRTRRAVTDAEIMRYLERTLAGERNPREWYWALMDYGSSMREAGKGKSAPVNPNRKSAHYRKQSAFKGSARELRGKILRYLLAEKGRYRGKSLRGVARARLAEAVGAGGTGERNDLFRRVVSHLVREGFIIEKSDSLFLAL
jgi:A/G-specific adenine glycosylase